jgi:hypothetical protein
MRSKYLRSRVSVISSRVSKALLATASSASGQGRSVGWSSGHCVTSGGNPSDRRVCLGWHDAVADQQFSGDVLPFPKAWTPATEIGEYQIVPLETPRDLYCEGKAMHNCVTTF